MKTILFLSLLVSGFTASADIEKCNFPKMLTNQNVLASIKKGISAAIEPMGIEMKEESFTVTPPENSLGYYFFNISFETKRGSQILLRPFGPSSTQPILTTLHDNEGIPTDRKCNLTIAINSLRNLTWDTLVNVNIYFTVIEPMSIIQVPKAE